LKKVLCILAFSFLLKLIFPVIDYVVNYNYISKVLCVNKDKPMLHCNGKCYLYKQLLKAQQESAEKKLPISLLKLKTTSLFIVATIDWNFTFNSFFRSLSNFATLQSSPKSGYYLSLPKPPNDFFIA